MHRRHYLPRTIFLYSKANNQHQRTKIALGSTPKSTRGKESQINFGLATGSCASVIKASPILVRPSNQPPAP